MKFRSIQVLRAVAALAVVLFHLDSEKFYFGWAGVDLFFVISGFIMGTVGVKERPLDFARNRIVRIVPVYWLVTLLMCGLAITTNIMSHFSFTLPELAKSLLFIPYFDQSGHAWPLVVPGWTLNFEMFFYAIFTVALLTTRPILATVTVLVLLVLAGPIMPAWSAQASVWTSPMLLEFAAGLLLSAFASRIGKNIGRCALIAGVIGAIASSLVHNAADGSLYLRVATFGISALLIVIGALSVERESRWPTWLSPVEHVGNISYSMYLLHGLVLATGAKAFGKSLWAEIATVVVVFLVAEISYRLFEVRVSRLLRAPRRASAELATGYS